MCSKNGAEWYPYCVQHNVWHCLACSHATYSLPCGVEMCLKNSAEWYPYAQSMALFGLFTCHILGHMPYHWNVLKKWCKMIPIFFITQCLALFGMLTCYILPTLWDLNVLKHVVEWYPYFVPTQSLALFGIWACHIHTPCHMPHHWNVLKIRHRMIPILCMTQSLALFGIHILVTTHPTIEMYSKNGAKWCPYCI